MCLMYVYTYLHHQSSARVSTAAKARDILFLVVVVVYSVLLQTVHVVGGYFVRGSRDLRWGISFVDCETKPLCRLHSEVFYPSVAAWTKIQGVRKSVRLNCTCDNM